MFELLSGYGVWHRRYFVLEACTLHYWNHPNDRETKVEPTSGQESSSSQQPSDRRTLVVWPPRQQRATSSCPAPLTGTSEQWRGARVHDLSPLNWWMTSSSSRTAPVRTIPSKRQSSMMITMTIITIWILRRAVTILMITMIIIRTITTRTIITGTITD